MKLAVFIIFSFFQFSRADQFESRYTNYSIDTASKEVFDVPCENDELANLIRQQRPVVPSRIYHYGPERAMDENIHDHTIPEKSWDNFIMGSKTKFGLDPIRRGLYGTAGLEVNTWERSGDKLIAVEIKPECRYPDKVFTFEKFWEDPRFISWFKQNESIFSPNIQDCILRQPTGFDSWSCSHLLNSFIEDMDIKIIHDNHYEANKSFYIRDRACISNIYGKPEEMLVMMASQVHFWKKSCLPSQKKLFEEYNKFVSTFDSVEINCESEFVGLINKNSKEEIVRMPKVIHPGSLFLSNINRDLLMMIYRSVLKFCQQSNTSIDLNFLKSELHQQILLKEIDEQKTKNENYFYEGERLFENYLRLSKLNLNHDEYIKLEGLLKNNLQNTLQPQYADELILKLKSP